MTLCLDEGPSSQFKPSQSKSSQVDAAAPGLMRGESTSSIRSTTRPSWLRDDSHASRYVRALPTCCAP